MQTGTQPNRRRRAARALASAGAAALLPWGTTGAAEDTGEGSSGGPIRIGGGGLHPRVFIADRDERVSWTNEEEQQAVLSFPTQVAEAFTCDADPRPELIPDGEGRLLSMPIRARLFALPCPLEPGTYAYRAHLLRGKGPPGAPVAPPAQVRNPDATFDGTIVVE